jgi:hypothetical protein
MLSTDLNTSRVFQVYLSDDFGLAKYGDEA